MRFSNAIRQLSGIVFILLFIPARENISAWPNHQGNDKNHARIEKFDLLTAGTGWILIDQHLFWTDDAGSSWEEIGLPIPSGSVLQDVTFTDPNTGWMLWTSTNIDLSTAFHLAFTNNRGQTWSLQTLDLSQPAGSAPTPEKIEMTWFDEQTGWISIKQVSSSNFSLGSLYTTSDGGRHWHQYTLPVADSIYFSDPKAGWAIGGSSEDQIFESLDGGASWRNIGFSDISIDMQAEVYPLYSSNGLGLLVVKQQGNENRLEIYAFESQDGRWSMINQMKMDAQPGMIGFSALNENNLVAVIPGTKSVIQIVNGTFHLLENVDGLSDSIVELDMISLDAGWAKSITSNCVIAPLSETGTESVTCSSTTQLLYTSNGGVNWQKVALPAIAAGTSSSNALFLETPMTTSSTSGPGNTEVLIGQGFDKCEIPTLSQMQTWAQGSPYQAVNLYIGGSSRACDNNALISSYLFQLYQQGWKFIPTWVGPQAPCTVYQSQMSSDPATARQQGVNQANLAVERLATLGLTDPAKTGSVVYYDIEYYGFDSACRSAVNAFMDGWVSQIRARGNLAGVYGSTLCNTGLSDFLNIANVPDVVWPARWYHNLGSGFYDPNASVWNLGNCIPNTAWSNHQRIRQYEGDHNESWGGLTLGIDSNVLDGVVAVPYDYPFVSAIVRADTNPSNANTVRFTVGFSKPVTGVDKNDFVLNTNGISAASIMSVSGSGTAYIATVNTGSGDGSIRLNLVDNDSIRDENNNPLGASGVGNGAYTYGETYTIVKSTFIDVPNTHMFWSEIEAFYNAGITTGCTPAGQTPKMYCPNANVTRAEMAVFLERALGNSAPSPNPTGMFSDVPGSFWASPFIDQFYNDGLTTGCAGGPLRYCPDNNVTRAEMATFIERALGNFNPSPNPTGMFADVPAPGLEHLTPFIEQFYNDGITTGCAANPLRYCPEDLVTRQEMAAFIVRAFDLPLP